MRKRLLSVLMALCMVLSLAPTMAFAAVPSSVQIAGQTLDSINPYYHNGTSSNPNGTANNTAAGASASFDASTGTLTLNGLHVNNGSIYWNTDTDLRIVLADGSLNTVVKTTGSAVLGQYTGVGSNPTGASLVIEGNGTLYAISTLDNASSKGCGIWVCEDITIQGNAKVFAQGVKSGISNNTNRGKITIGSGAEVTAVSLKGIGISADNGYTTGGITVNGKLIARGKTKALQVTPTVDTGLDVKMNKAYNGEGSITTNYDEALNLRIGASCDCATCPSTLSIPTATLELTSQTTGKLNRGTNDYGLFNKYTYRLGLDSNWQDIDNDNSVELNDLFEGCTIAVMWPGGSGTKHGSDIQIVTVGEYDGGSTPTEYSVTVTNDGNGSASASPTSAAEGTPVTLTATPDSGYQFKEWQVLSGGVTISGNEFTMGTANVEVKAVFEPATLSGTVSINGAAKFGEELAANVSDSNNTGTLSYQWKRDDVDITGATNDKYTLVAEDIGKEIKVVVTSSVQTGSISRDAGTVVKADGPAAPTGLNGVAPTTGSSSDGKITGTTSAMEYSTSSSFSSATTCADPETSGLASGTYYVRCSETATHFAGAYATVVVPAYSAPTFGVTVTAEGNGAVTKSADSAVEGAEITLTATPDSGYRFMGWTVVSGGVTIDNNKFTMPASAVEVKAVFEVIPPKANIGDATSIFNVEIPFENVFDCWRNPATVTASSVGQTQYCYNFDYPYSAKTDQQVNNIIGSVSDYSDYYYKFTNNGDGTITQTLHKYSDVTYEVVLADDGTVAAYGERCFLLYTDGTHYGTFVSFKDKDYHFHNTSACATSHDYGSATCIPCGCGESFVIGAFNPSTDDMEDMGNIVTPTPTPDPTPSTGSNKKPTYPAKLVKDADLENGTISFSKDRARAGRTVTITVTPDAGYVLDKLVILDDDNKAVDFKDNGDGTFTFVMPVGGVEVEPFFVKDAEDALVLVLFVNEKAYLLDEKPLVNDVAPVIKGERTMLPIRIVAESLGATVTWNEAEQSVLIKNGATEMVIYIGENFALVNGSPVELDASAFIENSRTYLPVRFVAENLGATVDWNNDTKEVTIVKK